MFQSRNLSSLLSRLTHILAGLLDEIRVKGWENKLYTSNATVSKTEIMLVTCESALAITQGQNPRYGFGFPKYIIMCVRDNVSAKPMIYVPCLSNSRLKLSIRKPIVDQHLSTLKWWDHVRSFKRLRCLELPYIQNIFRYIQTCDRNDHFGVVLLAIWVLHKQHLYRCRWPWWA